MTIDATLATRIVSDCFLGSDEEIRGVQESAGAVVVRLERRGWRLSPCPDPVIAASFGPDEVIDVRLDVAADPPPAPIGVGVRDGQCFRLDDAVSLSRFLAARDDTVEPEGLMALLCRYLAPDPPQVLVTGKGDQAAGAPAGSPPDLPGPQTSVAPSGATFITFYSYRPSAFPVWQDEPEALRWELEAGPASLLRWQTAPVRSDA